MKKINKTRTLSYYKVFAYLVIGTALNMLNFILLSYSCAVWCLDSFNAEISFLVIIGILEGAILGFLTGNKLAAVLGTNPVIIGTIYFLNLFLEQRFDLLLTDHIRAFSLLLLYFGLATLGSYTGGILGIAIKKKDLEVIRF